jgi:ankyrin repeat protein
MKITLPIKLGILIVAVFGLLIGGLLLWTPVRFRYYVGKLNSANDKERVKGVNGLIACGPAGRNALARNLTGGEAAADFLITHWPKANEVFAQDVYHRYPLHLAVAKGYPTVTELFITKGAVVNSKDTIGWTPLHWAAEYSDKTIAELLIANGAEVNAKGNLGGAPLHSAAIYGHKAVAALLIAEGAVVDVKDNDDWTPLHRAAEEGHKTTVELLIAKGAEINAKDNDSRTPLDLAIQEGKDKVAALIRKHGGKTGKDLQKETKK